MKKMKTDKWKAGAMAMAAATLTSALIPSAIVNAKTVGFLTDREDIDIVARKAAQRITESYIGEEDGMEDEGAEEAADSGVKHLILDMDFCTDVDDACALRMAAEMAKRGEIVLEAVTLSTSADSGQNISAVDGMLDYVGVSCPIGRSHYDIPDTSPYWGVLTAYTDWQWQEMDAADLWVQVLREYPDCTIVTTGYLTNLEAVCRMEFEDGTTGLDLLADADIFVVGGSYPTGTDNNFSYEPLARTASEYVSHNLKGIHYMTNDNGGYLLCGGKVRQEMPSDPLSKCLEAFQEEYGIDTSYGRAAWDPLGVYLAVKWDDGAEGFAEMEVNMDITNGTCTITQGGEDYRIYRISNDYAWYNAMLDNAMIQ